MRLLFLGDIVSSAARHKIIEEMPHIRKELALDFVVVNGENAAGGFGITEKICNELFDADIDCITTGNHAWDQREVLSFIDREPRLLRPANYPPNTPGKGAGLYDAKNGEKVLVVNLMGRHYMHPPLDDPFSAIERELEACSLRVGADFILVDMHAEACSEKMAMGHFCDGKASLVVGSHTHVPTADVQILPHGTAYQSDAGMCGDYDSVIGMDKEEPLQRFLSRIPSKRFTPAQGPPTLCGIIVETEPKTGLAKSALAFRKGARLQNTIGEK